MAVRRATAAIAAFMCALLPRGASAGTVDPASKAAADAKFVEACGHDLQRADERCEPVTPARVAAWKDVATRYEAWLATDPSGADAPRPAFRAALAAAELGDSARAVRDYESFLSTYGADDVLEKLKATDRSQYAERLDNVVRAYEMEAQVQAGALSIAKAAETYERIVNQPRLAGADRQRAGRHAMTFYVALGDRVRMQAVYGALIKGQPTPEQKLHADYIAACFDYDGWHPDQADDGPNRAARLAARSALEAFFAANKNNRVAGRYLIEAAWRLAAIAKAGGDTSRDRWLRATLDVWSTLSSTSHAEAVSSPYRDYGAAADYALLDEEISAVVPRSMPACGFATYPRNLATVSGYDARLERIGTQYGSLKLEAVTLARRGSLWEWLRRTVYFCGGSSFHPLTPQQEQQLAAMRRSGNPALLDLADELEARWKEAVRRQRDQWIDAADTAMIADYAQAIALAEAHLQRDPEVIGARWHLAYYADLLGDVRFGSYVSRTADPLSPSHHLQYKPRMYSAPRSACERPTARACFF